MNRGTEKALNAAAFFHPAYVRLLLRFAQAEGIDAVRLMSGCSLTHAEMMERELDVALADVRQIVTAMQRHVARPTLALEAGLQIDTAAHGVLSALLANSRDLRQAIGALQRFLTLRARSFELELDTQAGGMRLTILGDCTSLDISAFLLDYTAAMTSRMLRVIAGPAMREVRLELPWAEPRWSGFYGQLAGQLTFRAPRMAFWLPNTVLDAPNPTASSRSFRRAWDEAEAELGAIRHRASLQDRILDMLASASSEGWPTQDDIAARLAISRRTLVNRLNREGTRFRDLLDASRRDRAVWQIKHTNTPIGTIAVTLGYTDVSNFSRAFRRWYGYTPLTLRQAQRG